MSAPGTGQQQPGLYEVLEVSSRASQEVIQAAYRVLARACHPDVNPSPAAGRRMSELNAAYDVLGDTERRAAYDLLQARSRRSAIPVLPTRPATIRGTPPANVTRRTDDRRTSVPTAPPLQRPIRTVVLIMVFVVVLIVAIWLMLGLLEEDPPRYWGSASACASLAQPFLNRG